MIMLEYDHKAIFLIQQPWLCCYRQEVEIKSLAHGLGTETSSSQGCQEHYMIKMEGVTISI